MPLFDHECPKCEYVDEYLVFKESEVFVCPKCKTDMKKLPVGIINTRYALYEGVWETDPKTGRDKYLGKGGRQVPFSSRLPGIRDFELDLPKDKFYGKSAKEKRSKAVPKSWKDELKEINPKDIQFIKDE